MKYAIIIIAIIVLVRFETILKLVDRTQGLVTSSETLPTEQAEVNQSVIVPVSKDKSFEQTPDQRIVTLIEDFYRTPTDTMKNLIISDIKGNPALFGETGHPGYLNIMSRMVSHIQQKNSIVNDFLFELWPLVKGANLLIVKQLLAMNFEENLVLFLDQLSKSGRDPSCFIAEMIPDGFTKEEKERFLNERRANLEKVSYDETQAPKVKTMSINCFRTVEIEILKLNPPPVVTPENATP